MSIKKRKKLIVFLLTSALVLSLAGCGRTSDSRGGSSLNSQGLEEDLNLLESQWEDILRAAEGTTVTYYGWGGSDSHNSWVDGYLADRLKEEYNISLKRVGMDIDEILNNLLNEKQVSSAKGNIDVVWINGENFFTARENDLLFGPFTEKLPNFNKYVDGDALDIKYDFGYPVEGYEAPYGKAQFVMIYDSEKIRETPRDHRELLEWAKANPGKFTYPALPDFTGSAFVRNIISDIVGYEKFMDMEANEEKVREAIEPALEYLKELKPYLWKEGRTYPAESSLLDNMYSDGEVWMTMGYNPNAASTGIITGQFKDSTRTFLFDKGTVGNTNFLAIPFNSPNKAGAMVVIDFILSVEAQVSKYRPETRGDLPVLDNSKLSPEEKAMFDRVDIGEATLAQDVLADHRIPEMPADLVPIIEKIWMERVPGEGD